MENVPASDREEYDILCGQLNPAVSLALATLKKISFKEFVINSIAQVCGAFWGAVFAYWLYYSKSKNILFCRFPLILLCPFFYDTSARKPFCLLPEIIRNF